MDTNENSRLVPKFTARFRKLKFIAKAFVAAHYKSVKFIMILIFALTFCPIPHSCFFIPLIFLINRNKADDEMERHFI